MNLTKPKNGFVLGKFMPPTTGHVYLCDFAQNYCHDLTILVCSLPDEPIEGKLRYEWMKQLFPKCNVLWCPVVLPQEPKDENDLEFWEIWKKAISRYTYGQKFDVVFASENYGHRLAQELEAEFVPCDISKTAQSCSGTEVRKDPIKNWKYIPEVVRPYFTKRVCLFGPESSGKTTLAKYLAEYYQTVMIPEYGRAYTEYFGSEVNSKDLENIVKGHISSRNALIRQANNGLVIEDTDPIMTSVWGDMLHGEHDPWFDTYTDYADLYILCDVDIPWVDDGTRYYPNEDDRKRFFSVCENELIKRKVNYCVVSGGYRCRNDLSKRKITELLYQ